MTHPTKHLVSLAELRAPFPDVALEPRRGLRPTLTATEYDHHWLARIAHKTVENEKGCWVWQGFILHKGYGGTTYRSRNVMVHRQVYRILIKADLATQDFVCHRCDNPPCWNPDHLWLGDPLTNQQDKNAKRRNFWTNKTHCKNGHEFTPENTYVRRGQPKYGYGPARWCLTCAKIRMNSPEYKEKARERRRRAAAEKRSQVTV